jgi:hypothetical protein
VALTDLTLSAEAMAGTGMRIRWTDQSVFERKPRSALDAGRNRFASEKASKQEIEHDKSIPDSASPLNLAGIALLADMTVA